MADEKNKVELSYVEARTKLVEIVQELESGIDDIEKSLKLWDEANELAKFCQAYLETAKKKIDTSLDRS
jgi:exodeoxyribonuclease VII small subunit